MGVHSSDTHYDVIIVGGRPAGASLAARLGQQQLRTLVLERADFPSGPAVSSPFLLSSGMRLLDEIGADEADYARNTPKIHRFVLEFKDYFRSFGNMANLNGRDYMYTVNRAQLDTHLWRNLAQFPSVTARENCTVVDLLCDSDSRVTGVTVREAEQPLRAFTADLVVGADGRYSLVARKAGASITEQRSDVDTTVYYAYWENIAPYDNGDTIAHIHTSGDGYSFVFMPTANGQSSVLVQGRSDYFDPAPGHIEERYQQLLRTHSYVWRRLKNAVRVSDIRGIKRMGNLYREAGGAGWVLVGDALHQKDSIDAQGIYDALIEAKFLSQAITNWKHEGQPWSDVLRWYDQMVQAETHAMFEATMERVKREIYETPPPLVAKTILRWLLTDEEYMHRFSLLLGRGIPPQQWAPPSLLIQAIVRGMGKSLKQFLTRQRSLSTMPPLPIASNRADWESRPQSE